MILAIESASADPSVALAGLDGSPLASDAWSGDSRQGSQLLPRLLDLLAQRGAQLRDLRAVAVGLGPGSFTGLRVGMSVAKGLALALSVPIIGVPSLVAWLAAEPIAAAALNRAGAKDAYLLVRGEDAPRIVPFDELPIFVDRIVVAPRELATALSLRSAIAPQRAAAQVAGAAAARLAADQVGDDLALLEPAYLRAPRGTDTLTPWP